MALPATLLASLVLCGPSDRAPGWGIVVPAGWSVLGPADPGSRLTLRLALNSHQPAELLAATATAVSDPSDRRYGAYLGLEELTPLVAVSGHTHPSPTLLLLVSPVSRDDKPPHRGAKTVNCFTHPGVSPRPASRLLADAWGLARVPQADDACIAAVVDWVGGDARISPTRDWLAADMTVGHAAQLLRLDLWAVSSDAFPGRTFVRADARSLMQSVPDGNENHTNPSLWALLCDWRSWPPREPPCGLRTCRRALWRRRVCRGIYGRVDHVVRSGVATRLQPQP